MGIDAALNVVVLARYKVDRNGLVVERTAMRCDSVRCGAVRGGAFDSGWSSGSVLDGATFGTQMGGRLAEDRIGIGIGIELGMRLGFD